MNKDIADILKGYVGTVGFADLVGGMVKTITFAEGEEGAAVIKRMPVDCGVTHAQCMSGKYSALLPDGKKKSVMYFEDNGVTLVGQDVQDFTFQSKLTLVCWLNLKKLGKTDCSASALAIATILNTLPTKYFNSGIYTRIQIQVESEQEKSPSIFSRYTYDDEKIQFLMYPYDYFALNISVKFTIPKACIPAWSNQPETCDE